MATWEYQTIKVPFTGGWEAPTLKPADFDALLNRHGQDGWELVTIFTTHQERPLRRSLRHLQAQPKPISPGL